MPAPNRLRDSATSWRPSRARPPEDPVIAVPPARDEPPAPARPLVQRLLPLLVLAVILGLFFAFRLDRHVSLAALREHRATLTGLVQSHLLVAGLGFVALYAAIVAASLPVGALASITGGLLFGTWLGTGLVVTGATLGATLLFLAARTAVGDALKRRLGSLGSRLAAELTDNAASYLLVLRLVPLFPFWVVNLVPAFVGVPLRIYVVTTFLGIIPATFVYVSIGNGLGAVFDRGETPDLGVIFSPAILTPLIGLALLALVPVVYRRLRARRSAA